MPTAHAAAPLRNRVVTELNPVPVWPHKNGTTRGTAFYPLYPSVSDAAARVPALGELLTLFDAVRGGCVREKTLAIGILRERLKP